MAAPAQIGTATTAAAQSATITAAAPAGVTTGDHQVVVVVAATTGETVNPAPAGWFLAATQTMTSTLPTGDTTRLLIYTADPDNDPGSAGFSLGKSGNRLWSTTRFAYRGGVGVGNVIIQTRAVSSTTHAAPTQTTTTADSVVVAGVVLDESGATSATATVTPPAGWTELAEISTLTTTGTREALTLGVAAVEQATAGDVTGTFETSISQDALVWSLTVGGDEVAPAPLPLLVQQSGVTSTGQGATTISAALPTAATAGNVLWFAVAGDKNLDGGTPLTGPDGFTRAIYMTTGNVTLLLAWKVAAGGETSASVVTASGNNLGGSDAWLGEYRQDGAAQWRILGQGSSSDNGTDVLVKSSGTTGALLGDGRALAAWAVDSTDTEGTATYTNGYVERGNPTAGNASRAGLWLAERDVTGGSTTESTMTRSGPGVLPDTMAAAVVAFGRLTSATLTGAATADLGALTAESAGTDATPGTAAAALGPVSASAAGERVTPAAGAAVLGALTGSAAGTRATAGSASASLDSFAASAAGVVTAEVVAGAASAAFGGVTATASGQRVTAATAAAALTGVSASASSTRTVTGAAATHLGGVTAAATGIRNVTGTGAAGLGTLAASAAGLRGTTGSATAALGELVASAAAVGQVAATAAAVLGGITSTSTGTRTVTAAATAPLAGLDAAAEGERAAAAGAVAALGGITTTASGTRSVTAAGSAALGGLTAAATGDGLGETTGSASAPLGGVTAAGVGRVGVIAAPTAPLGGLHATAAGVRTTAGVAPAPLGGVAATATGAATTGVAASAALGGLTASAAGARETRGAAAVAVALSVTTTGIRATRGAAAAALRGLTAEVARTTFAPGDLTAGHREALTASHTPAGSLISTHDTGGLYASHK